MSTSPIENEAQYTAAHADDGFDYIISGLNVRSQIELPSAIRADVAHAHPEVMIAFGDVPDRLQSPQREGPGWAIDGDVFLLHMPGLMRVLISNGNSIVATPEQELEPADLVLYLLGTCFAALLQQRGRVVLHASAVAVDGKAMLFCGQSGAGKSTIAAMLGQRGHPLLNDDVCSLSLNSDGEYAVYPDGRMLKLWAQSIEHLEWTGDESARVRRDVEKFYMAPDQVDLSPRPVGGVYILHALEGEGSAFLQELPTAEAMAELIKNAYRPALVNAMAMTPAYFQVSAGIKRSAHVSRLSRPIDFSLAHQALDLLEANWAKPVE